MSRPVSSLIAMRRVARHLLLPGLAAAFVAGCGGGGPGDGHPVPLDGDTPPDTSGAATSQTLTFAPAPALRAYDIATVSATASSGLAVSYSSLSNAICMVDSGSGSVTALAAGACTIAAHQAGNAQYQAAAQVTQTFTIGPAQTPAAAPGIPQGVSVSAGGTLGEATVNARQIAGGGSAITGYVVTSSPAGITAQSATLPVRVSCPNGSCQGYSFALAAANALGTGQASAASDLLVQYDVHQIYTEPSYAYDKTEFRGSFTFNASQGAVTGLKGVLSEVMAGNNQPNAAWPDGMPLLNLTHQLTSQPVAGGVLVGTFLNDNVLTLSADPRDNGTNGWQPGTGNWKYYGYNRGDRNIANPGNAYALIYVNTTDPTTTPTPAQIDLLAYADCAAQGMMGEDCMTGTTQAGYGVIGSMGGYPVMQTITRSAP